MNPSHLLLWAGLIFWVLGRIWLVQGVVYPLFAMIAELIRFNWPRTLSITAQAVVTMVMPISLGSAG